ncbi:MAG: DUF1553 domain-containing protein [Verrucomicrobiota bacterium]|nr:DUF1553 domain-containing protein [Verrucomicrobiota bacterium]
MRFSLKQLIFVFGFCFIVCFYNQAAIGDSIDYNRDIRPVLSRNCFSCHGPDDGTRKAGLRLDVREGVVAERKGAPVVVPGKRNESELYARLLVADKDEIMPPPDSGHELTSEEIELIGKWIDDGVAYDRHWAFVPPVRPKIPDVKDRDWVKNAIDYFILSELEATGHHPNKMADRYTIIRRLSLDLTGLPPSPAEVETFLNDKRSNAYESLVDDLLSRPAYGERWARVWLDLARFADSSGYGSDPLRVIWKYRDWVIDAFNQNIPYDQFTVDQLAGDLLTKPSRDQLLATAFHRNTKTNTEGGTDDEEFRTEAVRDRVDTTMQVWMGLTMGCAKCHTHKYDPITQKEYYQFYSFFNQSQDADRGDDSPRLPYPSKEQTEKLDTISKEIKSLESMLNVHTPELANGQQKWEVKSLRDLAKPEPKQSVWETVGPFKADSFDAAFSYSFEPESLAIGLNVAPQGEARQSSTAYDGFARLAIDGNTSGVYADNSVTHTQNPDDKSPWWEVVLVKPTNVSQVVLWNRAEASERLSAFRILGLDSKREVLFREDFFPENKGNPKSGEGFSIPFKAEREVSIVRVELLPVKGRNEPILSLAEVQVFSRTDDSRETDFEWRTKPQWNDDQVHNLNLGVNESIYLRRKLTAQIEGSQKISFGSGDGVKVWLNGREVLAKKIKRDAQPDQELVTVSLDKGENEILIKIVNNDNKSGFYFDLKGADFPEDILPILLVAQSERTSLQRKKIESHYRTFAKELDPLRKQIELKKKDEKKFRDSIVTTPYMQELPKGKRRKTYLLVKGNFLSKGEQVQAGFPGAFHKPKKDTPLNRLGVAKWLLQKDNPLTARVAVNRFWAQFFGRGLLDSEEDFGTQGNLPDHPELLDWLAVEFQEKGWDMKDLIKTIVMSATYSQSAKVHGELAESDFRNVRLGRGPRFRLEAEMVRDQALALSGLKSEKMYGPSVYPPQPPNLWQAAFNGQRNWATSSGEDRYRRGFYTFLRRTVPYPSMATFDAPSREICAVRRIRTNTPLQSFVTMNDEAYVEFAQAMAYRIYNEGGATAQDRIKYALKLALTKPPEANRLSALTELYESELAYYGKETGAAKNLYGKIAPLPIGADISEMAAFTVLANVLLNLDAILMKG